MAAFVSNSNATLIVDLSLFISLMCESMLRERIGIQTAIRAQSCLVCARAAQACRNSGTESVRRYFTFDETRSRYRQARCNVPCSCLRHLAHAFFEGTHVGPDVHYTLDDNLAPLNLMRSINDDSDSECTRHVIEVINRDASARCPFALIPIL